MDKLHQRVELNEPMSSSELPHTDWSKCIICQEDTDEVLKCPSYSKRDTSGAGYKTLAENLTAFDKIDCLPKTLNLSQLDEGEGIEETFRLHNAKFHDSCRLHYNKTKLQRAQKRKIPQERDPDAHKFTRQSSSCELNSKEVCFFCDKPAVGEKSLHNVSTFELDIRVRQCAHELQDRSLLAKLSAGDLIAQEAKYHKDCLTSLYNKSRDKIDVTDESDINHGIAFAGLISFIEEMRVNSNVAPVFKLTDLVNLYEARLKQLGTDMTTLVHSTRLKNRIITYFPDMEAHKQGRDVVLVFNKDIGAALGKACKHDADNDAVHMARAASIVRRDMFKIKQNFSGSFDTQCQEESVPASLLALVSMVLYGPNITAQSSSASTPQPALTLSQLLMHNSCVRQRQTTISTPTIKHNHERETPLPIYLGVMIHTKTRKKHLVDALFDLGLCVSYDRVLEICTELGNKVCHHYEEEKAVCPPQLKTGLFTTAAVDNIDHNPSSISAHDSFHGTGISLFQHPDESFTGIQRKIVVTPENPASNPRRTAAQLPKSYTNVPPIALPRQNPPIPKTEGPNKTDCHLIPQAVQKEYRYVDFCQYTSIYF